MTCSIALGPNDDLELTLPSGRRLYIPIANGMQFLAKILKDAETIRRGAEPRGYIAQFPTQAVIDTWAKNEMKAKREAEAAERWAEQGIDLAAIEINI